MKKSIQRRIQASYFVAIALVALIGIFSFYYLHQINREVAVIFETHLELIRAGEELQTRYQELARHTQSYLNRPGDPSVKEGWTQALNDFEKKVRNGKEISLSDANKERHLKLQRYIQELRQLPERMENGIPLHELHQQIRQTTDAMSDTVKGILSDRYEELSVRQENTKRLQLKTQRNMGFVIFLTFLGGIFLAFYFPGKVVLPIRRFISVLREVQDCNFEASINLKGNDELTQVGHEIDRLIARIREFDEMKIKRIAFERRKFDALANMVDVAVIVVSIEDEIVYMNSQLFNVLGLESEDVIGNKFGTVPLPQELKALLADCLETKEKFDNRELTMTIRNKEGKMVPVSVYVDVAVVRNHEGDVVNLIMTLEERRATWAERLFQRIQNVNNR